MKGNVSDFMAVEPRCREDRFYTNQASRDGCREASASRQFRTTFDVPVVVQLTPRFPRAIAGTDEYDSLSSMNYLMSRNACLPTSAAI